MINLGRSDRIFQILERPSQVPDFDVLSQSWGLLLPKKAIPILPWVRGRVVMYILYMTHLSNTHPTPTAIKRKSFHRVRNPLEYQPSSHPIGCGTCDVTGGILNFQGIKQRYNTYP